jgi:hypothetical protein
LQEKWRNATTEMSGYDSVPTPPAFGEAPKGLSYAGDAEYCAPWTLLGVPALSLPAGFGSNGLPLGVQIVGPYRQDHRTLRVANGWRARWVRAGYCEGELAANRGVRHARAEAKRVFALDVPGIHVLLNLNWRRRGWPGQAGHDEKRTLFKPQVLNALKHSRRLLRFQLRLPLPERRERIH